MTRTSAPAGTGRSRLEKTNIGLSPNHPCHLVGSAIRFSWLSSHSYVVEPTTSTVTAASNAERSGCGSGTAKSQSSELSGLARKPFSVEAVL